MSTSPSLGSGVGVSVNSKLSRLAAPSGRLLSKIWRLTLPAIGYPLSGHSRCERNSPRLAKQETEQVGQVAAPLRSVMHLRRIMPDMGTALGYRRPQPQPSVHDRPS